LNRLSISAGTARRWELQGRLTPYVISGNVSYDVQEVESLLLKARFANRKKPGPRPRNATASAHV